MVTLQMKLLIVLFLVFFQAAALAARVGDKTIGWPGSTLTDSPCYGNRQGIGPFNYLGTTPADRNTVERRHFTPQVENLVKGQSTAEPEADLAYTLNVYPNHHRALWSMSRYYLRKINVLGPQEVAWQEQRQIGIPPPECYFHRAMAFAPEDYVVPSIYGIYLHRRGELDKALQQYQLAEAKNPAHSELIYNMGLLYFDMEDYAKAEQYAEKAKKLGFPLTGLRNKLDRVQKAEGGGDQVQ